MPKSVSFTSPVAWFRTMFVGLMSLWMRCAWWSRSTADAMAIARSRKRPVSIGAPSTPSRGSPASSRIRAVRPPWCTRSRGRTAQAASSRSLRPYSWARRSRVARAGGSRAGSTTRTAWRPPLPTVRHSRRITRSPSSPRTGAPSRREGPGAGRVPSLKPRSVSLVCQGPRAPRRPRPPPFAGRIIPHRRPELPCAWRQAATPGRAAVSHRLGPICPA